MVRLAPRVVALLVQQEPVVQALLPVRQEPVAPVHDLHAASRSSLSYHVQCLGFLSCEGERTLTLSAHAGHPSPPEGGPAIEPSGCRESRIVQIRSSHAED
eukprot:541548-Pyramimonas_sp.AAC.2